MGRELLDLHIGFESIEPYPLKRVEKSSPVKTRKAAREASPYDARVGQPSLVKEDRVAPYDSTAGGEPPPSARLRADKERGIIVLDDQTSLTGVPPEAWRYRLGNRSALEWVLDQYKEKKPQRPDHPRAL